jgi:NAD dependent epimerase/dehydratase family enzyme
VKIVIAGGSGLLGTTLSRALLEVGHEVVILTRGRTRTPHGTRAVVWYPPKDGAWVGEVADAGALINLAGATIGRWPWTSRRKEVLRHSRLDATRALVDALAQLPQERRPPVLLGASGTDV